MAARIAPPPALNVTTDGQLLQEYLQSAGIIVNLQSGGAGQVASFLNREGQAEAVVVDGAGSAFHACREPLSDSGWNIFGIGAGFQSVAAIDGTTGWACGTDGNVWRCDRGRWTQTSTLGVGSVAAQVSTGVDGTVWVLGPSGVVYVKGSDALEDPPTINPGAASALLLDASGRLNFFCLDGDGAVWTIRQRIVGGSWGAWTALGAPSTTIALTSFVVAANEDGRLQAFGVGNDNALHTVYEQTPGGAWSAWGSVASQDPAIASLAVAKSQDGRIELFALSVADASGNVTLNHIWQTAPNNGWSAWTQLASPWTQINGLAVTLDNTGRLNLVLMSTANESCAWSQQSTPGGGWTSWSNVSVPTFQFMSLGPLAVDADGNLELFVIDFNGAVWNSTFESGAWQAWQSLFSPLPRSLVMSSLAIARNADGRLELFGQGIGLVFHIWQTTAGGSWSNWGSLSQPGQQGLSTLAVTLNGAGALELIALGGATSWHTAFDTIANGWMPWLGQWWSWYPLAGSAALTAMPSGRAGDFWAIAGNALTRWNGTAWSTVSLPNGLQPACLAVDGDGVVWIVASDPGGTFLRLEDSSFTTLASGLPGVIAIGAASASAIWAVAGGVKGGADLYGYRDGQWIAADTPHLFNLNWNNPVQLSVGDDGVVWLLDGSRNIWTQTSAPSTWSWRTFPAPSAGTTMRFLAAARGGNAWGIDSAGKAWQFKESWGPTASELPGGATMAQLSSGAAGTLWAIDASGSPYGYTPTGGWQSIAGTLPGPLVRSPTSWALARNALYQYIPPSGSAAAAWKRIAGNWSFQATAFSVGRDGTLVVLDATGALHAIDGSTAAISSAPAKIVQVAVVDADVVWAIVQDPTSGAFSLHLFREGTWELVTMPTAVFGATTTTPLLSSAPDGTVWLLGGDGVPRRLTWSTHAPVRRGEGATTSIRSVAAANIDPGTVGTGQPHEAWAVTASGMLRRSFGEGGAWIDTHTSLPLGASAVAVSAGADGSVWAIDTARNLYQKQAWIQSPVGSSDGPSAITAASDAGGALHVVTIDGSGGIWGTRQTSSVAGSPWMAWRSLPAPPQQLATLQAATRQDRSLHLLGVAVNGVIVQSSWNASTSTWGAFAPLGGSGQPAGTAIAAIVPGHDAHGRVSILALSTAGACWATTEAAGGGWSNWTALPSSVTFTALGGSGIGSANALAFFALDNDGGAHRTVQQSNGGFGAWQALGSTGLPAGVTLAVLTAGVLTNGALTAIGAGSDGTMYVSSAQPAAPTGWSAWTTIGGVPGVAPRALVLGGKTGPTMSLLMLGSDGAVYTSVLTSSWSAWSATGATGLRSSPLTMMVASTSSGSTLLVAGGAGSVWITSPDASSPTGWGDWRALSGTQSWQPRSTPSPLAQAPVGSAQELWAVFRDGSVRVTLDGATWQPVAFRSAGAPAKAVGVSLGTDGVIRAVTATDCYAFSGTVPSGTWMHVGTHRFGQAPVGRATNLWAVDTVNAVWRSRDGGANWWQDNAAPAATQLSACADGSIWSIAPQGAASLAAGWARVMRPTGMAGLQGTAGVSEIAAGADENGTRYVFMVVDGALSYSYEIAHHAWVEPFGLDGLSAVSGIAVTNQQDTGALIAWSAASAGLLAAATKVAGQRYAFGATMLVLESATPQTVNGPVELVAASAAQWSWLAVAGAQIVAGTSAGPTGGAVVAPLDIAPTFGGASIVQLPWPRRGSALFGAVLDAQSQLWIVGDVSIESASATTLQLTGSGTSLSSGVSSLAALLQADAWAPPQPRLYAMASDSEAGSAPALWMLNVVDAFASVAQAGSWSAWTPLGENYASIANGPFGAPVDTLFGILAAGSSLGALRQNRMTGAWSDGIVKRPSQSGTDIVQLAMYQTEAAFTDGNGIPAPGAAVTVFAATPIEAWINNTVYALDAAHGVTVTTNQRGKLLVKTLATGLSAPQLTFTAAGLDSGVGSSSITPSQHLYDFFHGPGTLPINGGKPTTMTAGGLQSLNTQLTQPAAQKAVNDMNTIAGLPGASTPPPPGGPRLSVEKLPGFSIGGAWDKIKHAGEAVVHAIDKKIVKAVVDVEGDIVKVTILIEGEVVALVRMAIKTADDAVRAIEAVVAAIVTDLKTFIEWLKLLFDWGNILKTQNALIGLLDQGVDVLIAQLGVVEGKVAEKFDELKQQLAGAFASITSQSSIGGFTTFSELPKTVSTGSPRPPGVRRPVASQPVSGASSVHHNWFLNKVLDHVTPKFSVPAIVGVDAGAFLGALNIHDAISEFGNSAKDLLAFLETIFSQPAEFASKGIVDLLKAAEAFLLGVINLIEGLIEALLVLAQQVLAGLLDMLNARVEIPLIDTLFKLVDGKPMTMMNLGTLALAFPAYILFHVIYPTEPGPLWTDGAGGVLGLTPQQQTAHAFLAFGLIEAVIIGLYDLSIIIETPFATQPPTFGFIVALLGGVMAGSLRIMAWPDKEGFPNVPSSFTTAEIELWFNWGVYWLPALYGLAAQGVPPLGGDVAQVVRTVLGCAGLISGLGAAVAGLGAQPPLLVPEMAVAMIIQPFGLMMSFLLVKEIRQEIFSATDGLFDPAWLVLIVNGIDNVAIPILRETALG